MNALEKAAYLKGLVKGLDLQEDAKETKIFMAMLDLLQELADDVADLESEVEELSEVVDAIDEDLGELEEDFLDIVLDDADEEACHGGHHHGHGHDCGCGNDDDWDDEDEDFDMDGGLYQVICPSCDELIYLDETLLTDGEVICPACGEHLEFGLEDEDDDDIDAEIAFEEMIIQEAQPEAKPAKKEKNPAPKKDKPKKDKKPKKA